MLQQQMLPNVVLLTANEQPNKEISNNNVL